MNLKLVTLGGVKLDEAVYSVTIPTIDGEISVLPSHEPLVTVARDGVITVRRAKETQEEEFFAISGGVVEIDQTGVRILDADRHRHAPQLKRPKWRHPARYRHPWRPRQH